MRATCNNFKSAAFLARFEANIGEPQNEEPRRRRRGGTPRKFGLIAEIAEIAEFAGSCKDMLPQIKNQMNTDEYKTLIANGLSVSIIFICGKPSLLSAPPASSAVERFFPAFPPRSLRPPRPPR
jgi:hypothetical protein